MKKTSFWFLASLGILSVIGVLLFINRPKPLLEKSKLIDKEIIFEFFWLDADRVIVLKPEKGAHVRTRLKDVKSGIESDISTLGKLPPDALDFSTLKLSPDKKWLYVEFSENADPPAFYSLQDGRKAILPAKSVFIGWEKSGNSLFFQKQGKEKKLVRNSFPQMKVIDQLPVAKGDYFETNHTSISYLLNHEGKLFVKETRFVNAQNKNYDGVSTEYYLHEVDLTKTPIKSSDQRLILEGEWDISSDGSRLLRSEVDFPRTMTDEIAVKMEKYDPVNQRMRTKLFTTDLQGGDRKELATYESKKLGDIGDYDFYTENSITNLKFSPDNQAASFLLGGKLYVTPITQ